MKEASECSRCVAQDVLGMYRLRRNAEGKGIVAESRREAYVRVRQFWREARRSSQRLRKLGAQERARAQARSAGQGRAESLKDRKDGEKGSRIWGRQQVGDYWSRAEGYRAAGQEGTKEGLKFRKRCRDEGRWLDKRAEGSRGS